MTRQSVFAIIRIDQVISPTMRLMDKISVVKVMWDWDQAEAEAVRLNTLNGGKGCTYFATATRLVDPIK